MASPIPIADRVWRNIDQTTDPDGCWPWIGAKMKAGYGISFTGSRRLGTRKRVLAHRLTWMTLNGPIPAGLFVLHHCDNPPCCRPDHLFLGTQADNLADMTKKGRRKGWPRRDC